MNAIDTTITSTLPFTPHDSKIHSRNTSIPTCLAHSLHTSYKNHQPWLRGKRIWLACSGGRDSLSLAHLTQQLYLNGILPFCPQLVHINHGLQIANNEWEDKVAQWAKLQNIPCVTQKINLTNSDEQSARNARYRAIMSLMKQDDVLMLAHHADDQAETLLMRLFTGAGVTGLSAIKEWTSKTLLCSTHPSQRDSRHIHNHHQHNSHHIHLWRPWLNVSRDDISQYATQHQLPYVDDPTNLSGNNTRSWLRRELMPIIKQRYPQASTTMNRSAGLLSDADDILTQVYHIDKKACTLPSVTAKSINIHQQGKSISYHDLCDDIHLDMSLNIMIMRQLTIARQRLLVHRWLKGDEPTAPSEHRVQEVLELIHRPNNDQQAELIWQGEHSVYSIRRYRHELHRLRADWLEWLSLPITTDIYHTNMTSGKLEHADQPQQSDSLSTFASSITSAEKPVAVPNQLILKQNECFSWQIHSTIFNLSRLVFLPPETRIQIRTLSKHDKVDIGKLHTHITSDDSPTVSKYALDTADHTVKSRIKSGKKLLQDLGIPSWKRSSVIVIDINGTIVCLLTPRRVYHFYHDHLSDIDTLSIQSEILAN